MSSLDKYALLDYTYTENGFVNVGDHIQSLAAKQFLPKVDCYIDRENLNNEHKSVKAIMNGWYMHNLSSWPPSKEIEPLFVSFHLNPRAYQVLERKEVVDYLKNHQPIGCRDYTTMEILEKYGVECYYSFCLTSTLGETYKSDKKNDKIIFNDVLYKYAPAQYNAEFSSTLEVVKTKLKNIKDFPRRAKRNKILNSYFPKEILDSIVEFKQDQKINLGRDNLFARADYVLKEYAQAKLVATSRIHSAIPCIGLGTPVLFLLDGVDDPSRDLSRFNGVLDHINLLTRKSETEVAKIFGRKMPVIHPEDIDWDTPPQNPNTHLDLTSNLIKVCRDFING